MNLYNYIKAGQNRTSPKGYFMIHEKIERINQLARKAKTEGLSEEEKAEQAALRAEYIADFRKNFTGILDNTYIQRPDGQKTRLKRNTKEKEN